MYAYPDVADDEACDRHGCGRAAFASATLKDEGWSVLVAVQVALTDDQRQKLVKHLPTASRIVEVAAASEMTCIVSGAWGIKLYSLIRPNCSGATSWRHGSLVRKSAFRRRTFTIYVRSWIPYDHFVGKVSAMGQPTRPTQPSIPRDR